MTLQSMVESPSSYLNNTYINRNMLQNVDIFFLKYVLCYFQFYILTFIFMTDRNETTSSTNPMTNVVYEDIREDTNDERNKGKN